MGMVPHVRRHVEITWSTKYYIPNTDNLPITEHFRLLNEF